VCECLKCCKERLSTSVRDVITTTTMTITNEYRYHHCDDLCVSVLLKSTSAESLLFGRWRRYPRRLWTMSVHYRIGAEYSGKYVGACITNRGRDDAYPKAISRYPRSTGHAASQRRTSRKDERPYYGLNQEPQGLNQWPQGLLEGPHRLTKDLTDSMNDCKDSTKGRTD
jgi:hypothetical protein